MSTPADIQPSPSQPSLRNLVSALDARMEADGAAATLRLRAVIDQVGTSAHAPVIFALALPMVIPMPPGLPTLAGGLIAATALFWLIGRGRMKLPQRVEDARLKVAPLRKWIARLDRWLDPLTGETHALTALQTRVAALMCILLGILMALPIPLVGNIPPAIAVCILALAAIDRSRKLFYIGCTASMLALALAFGFGATAVQLAGRMVG